MNLDNAAIKAYETLLKYDVISTPVSPLPIIKRAGALVLSFTELSVSSGKNRDDLIELCGNEDAATAARIIDGHPQYIVAYNRTLKQDVVQRALARELGHIILEHDGTRQEDVRNMEALHFAQHLLCPRPLIKAIQDAGITITTNDVGNLTGFDEECLSCIRQFPGANVPAELNRKVKDLFAENIQRIIRYRKCRQQNDGSDIADFGSFMDNYEE